MEPKPQRPEATAHRHKVKARGNAAARHDQALRVALSVSAQQFRQLHLQTKALSHLWRYGWEALPQKSRSRPRAPPPPRKEVGTTFAYRLQKERQPDGRPGLGLN
jgi:hypothetical protein